MDTRKKKVTTRYLPPPDPNDPTLRVFWVPPVDPHIAHPRP